MQSIGKPPLTITGAKNSYKFCTFITSTGVPSLDQMLNGLVCGSITALGMFFVADKSLCIQESDFHQTYSKLLVNLFVAEGLLSGHNLLYASVEDLEHLFSKLPDVSNITEGDTANPDIDLKIAWRYENAPNLENPVIPSSKKMGHNFDLAKPMDVASRLKEKKVNTLHFSPSASKPLKSNLSNLLDKLEKFISENSTGNVQRIVLHSLGSPSWGYCYNSRQLMQLLLQFFAALHLLVQNTLTVVYITLSPTLPPGLLARIRHYCDYVFRIEGFDTYSEKNSAYSQHDGLFTVIQLPWYGNTLETVVKPPTLEWCFKVKRHQLIIQSADNNDLGLPPDAQYDPSLAVGEIYQTGGYYFTGTEIMNCLHPTDHIADVAFDPVEELVWCISRMGQLSAFYSTTLERYITTTIPLMSTMCLPDSEAPFTEFKQVFPSFNPAEHYVVALANNGLHVYSKSGRSIGSSLDKLMVELECMAATGPTGGTVGGLWSGHGMGNFSRLFVGGLQSMLLELDANERWGEVVSALDVGIRGSVVLRPFSSGICAGNTGGKVLVIDPRSNPSIVRELDAHTGEISDITVGSHGHTLVTCGWSRLGDYNLRVDRLLKVYDLRFGRAQIPVTAAVDPSLVRFVPGCSDRLLAASQAGALQTIQWGKPSYSPDDLGQLWLGYDRLTALDISQNGNGLIFATEGGQLQLYLRDMNIGQFNVDPAPTEFALPLAESLWFTNSLNGAAPPSYPHLLIEDPSNVVYGTNLFTVGKAAADAAGLQLLTTSLHQPTLLNPESSRASDFMDLVERRKAEAANEAVTVAYKPVDYDDYRFSLASIPFAADPPPSLYDSSNFNEDGTSNYHSKSTNQTCSSDWPEDMRQSRTRVMLQVDPELLANVDRKNTVRKPSDWGTVWHPYPIMEQPEDHESELVLGRLENGNHQPVELTVST